MKRTRYKGKFDFIYTSDSQVIVKRLATGGRIILNSHYGYPIEKLDIFRDKFIVSYTTNSLLLGDMGTCKLSELRWKRSGNERMFFDIDHLCLVFNDGELSVIEYGTNEIVGQCRTEFFNPHLLRYVFFVVFECKTENESACFPSDPLQGKKVLAFLVDEQTIQMQDLATGSIICTVHHDLKITWIELSMAGDKILFKDAKSHLFVYACPTHTKSILTLYCSYAQVNLD